MREGTYAVTVRGFVTLADAEDYARTANESFEDLEAEVTAPDVKSFNVQRAEREAEADGSIAQA